MLVWLAKSHKWVKLLSTVMIYESQVGMILLGVQSYLQAQNI